MSKCCFKTAKDAYIEARETQRKVIVMFLEELGLRVLSDNSLESKDRHADYVIDGVVNESDWDNWKRIEAIREATGDYYYVSLQAHDINDSIVCHILYDRIGVYKGNKADEHISFERMKETGIDLPVYENGKIYKDKLIGLIDELMEDETDTGKCDDALDRLNKKLQSNMKMNNGSLFVSIKKNILSADRASWREFARSYLLKGLNQPGRVLDFIRCKKEG